MYYLWSLVISIIAFALVQYSERNKDPLKYNLYSVNNIAIFFIIYLLTTMIFFIFTESSVVGNSKKNGMNGKNGMSGGGSTITPVDPIMLRKISDPVYTGFEPFYDSE